MEQPNLEKQQNNKVNIFAKNHNEISVEIKSELEKINKEIYELEHMTSLNGVDMPTLEKMFLRLGVGMDKKRDRLNLLYKQRHSIENKIKSMEVSHIINETIH